MTILKRFFYESKTLIFSFFGFRALLKALILRDIQARYRGSVLGVLWSLLTPLVQLATYYFVFGILFQSRWGQEDDRPIFFILNLFCGLIPFTFFSEVISKSPEMILRSPNYVKRIAFPVHLLSAVAVGSCLFHAVISLGLLLIGILFGMPDIGWHLLWLPVIWLPFLLFTLALSVFVAGVGVFLRDLGHMVGLGLNILFFLTPIFYPVQLVPHSLSWLLLMNPVACVVMQMRTTGLLNQPLDARMWGFQFLGSLIFFIVVAAWFRLISRRFADVL